MTALMLTDDEVVAIAVDGSGYWPGALPTIDVGSEESLASAAFRGQRSLLVRGLLDEGGELSDEVRLLAGPLVSSKDYVSVYLGADDLNRAAWGLASTHYRGEFWVLETVTVLGVHRIAIEPVADQRDYLTGLLTAAVSDGPEGLSAESRHLCLAAIRPSDPGVLAARRGELRWVRTEPETGSVIESLELAMADLHAAVDRLMPPQASSP